MRKRPARPLRQVGRLAVHRAAIGRTDSPKKENLPMGGKKARPPSAANATHFTVARASGVARAPGAYRERKLKAAAILIVDDKSQALKLVSQSCPAT